MDIQKKIKTKTAGRRNCDGGDIFLSSWSLIEESKCDHTRSHIKQSSDTNISIKKTVTSVSLKCILQIFGSFSSSHLLACLCMFITMCQLTANELVLWQCILCVNECVLVFLCSRSGDSFVGIKMLDLITYSINCTVKIVINDGVELCLQEVRVSLCTVPTSDKNKIVCVYKCGKFGCIKAFYKISFKKEIICIFCTHFQNTKALDVKHTCFGLKSLSDPNCLSA